MSKKKSKKFKKNKPRSNPAPTSTTSAMSDIKTETAEITTSQISEIETRKVDPYDQPEYEHVKKDVKKILFLISIIIVLFVGAWVLSTKTTVLASFGDWIYKITNIQAE